MGAIITKLREICPSFIKRTQSHENFLDNLNAVFLDEDDKSNEVTEAEEKIT